MRVCHARRRTGFPETSRPAKTSDAMQTSVCGGNSFSIRKKRGRVRWKRPAAPAQAGKTLAPAHYRVDFRVIGRWPGAGGAEAPPVRHASADVGDRALNLVWLRKAPAIAHRPANRPRLLVRVEMAESPIGGSGHPLMHAVPRPRAAPKAILHVFRNGIEAGGPRHSAISFARLAWRTRRASSSRRRSRRNFCWVLHFTHEHPLHSFRRPGVRKDQSINHAMQVLFAGVRREVRGCVNPEQQPIERVVVYSERLRGGVVRVARALLPELPELGLRPGGGLPSSRRSCRASSSSMLRV